METSQKETENLHLQQDQKKQQRSVEESKHQQPQTEPTFKVPASKIIKRTSDKNLIPLVFPHNRDYTTVNITSRWSEARDAWLNPKSTANQSKQIGPSKREPLNQEVAGNTLKSYIEKPRAIGQSQKTETDVRNGTPSRPMPEEEIEPSIYKQVRRIMKSQSGPYARFDSYYPLEEAIEMYMDIWYDSDSSSDSD